MQCFFREIKFFVVLLIHALVSILSRDLFTSQLKKNLFVWSRNHFSTSWGLNINRLVFHSCSWPFWCPIQWSSSVIISNMAAKGDGEKKSKMEKHMKKCMLISCILKWQFMILGINLFFRFLIQHLGNSQGKKNRFIAVSYTHLTLPTKA